MLFFHLDLFLFINLQLSLVRSITGITLNPIEDVKIYIICGIIGRQVCKSWNTYTNSCLILESIPRIGMYTSILGASAGEPLLFKLQEKAQKYFKIHGAKTIYVGTITYIHTRAECYGSNPLSTYQYFFWSVPMRRVIIYMLLSSSLLLVLKVRWVTGAQKRGRAMLFQEKHLKTLL